MTAKVTDQFGGVTTSAARSVIINASNTAPASGAVFAHPLTVTLSADASGIEANTPISKVEFYAGTALIGSATTFPYTISWTPGASSTSPPKPPTAPAA